MFFLLIYIILSLLISRITLKSNIFNIASLSLIIYWATYPLERLIININEVNYQTINGIKEKGIYMYAIFGFSFLLGSFLISKINIKKVNFYPSINAKNNLFFISIFLGLLGLLCFAITYNFNLYQYINSTLNESRSERMALLSKAKNALPYSIFFIPSITTLIVAIRKFGIKNLNSLFLSVVIILINSPILFSYFLEGDRTALIKFALVTLFTLTLTKSSIEKTNKKSYLIENYRINKKIFINRIKMTMILLSLFLILTFIGMGRNDGWKGSTRILINLSKQFERKMLPVGEFRGVNFTIDYALARNYLSIDKKEKMFTWDKFIFYPLPTYVYKGIFNEKKPLNIGDGIGLEVKNYIYGPKEKRKIGFGLSPIAEGLINFGIFGVILNGFIYGASIYSLQTYYNKISLEKINLLDIFILNTLGQVPLIMRSGTAGIYNWIFSTSFVMLLPILLIAILDSKKYLGKFKGQSNDI